MPYIVQPYILISTHSTQMCKLVHVYYPARQLVIITQNCGGVNRYIYSTGDSGTYVLLPASSKKSLICIVRITEP